VTAGDGVAIRNLPLPCAKEWTELTYPAYRRVLEQAGLEGRWCAIGASLEGHPAGLCLAETAPGTLPACIRSLFVAPEYRRRRIAAGLILAAGEWFRQLKWPLMKLYYSSGRPGPDGFEAYLLRQGWTGPDRRQLLIQSDAAHLDTMPWFGRYRLPAGFEMVPWVELTEGEREALREEVATGDWIPPDLVPFDFERDCHQVSSYALRHRGAVVAWVINHLLPSGMLRLTCSWARPDMQRRGRIVPVYEQSLRAAIQAGVRKGTWAVPFRHAAMIAFANRWLVPYSTSVRESRMLYRILQAQDSSGRTIHVSRR